MSTKKFAFNLIALFVIAATVLSACGAKAPATAAATEALVATAVPATEAPTAAPTEAPVDPMAALVDAAKAEGSLTTIALPHDWCNYGEALDTFKAKYGLTINELNPDLLHWLPTLTMHFGNPACPDAFF